MSKWRLEHFAAATGSSHLYTAAADVESIYCLVIYAVVARQREYTNCFIIKWFLCDFFPQPFDAYSDDLTDRPRRYLILGWCTFLVRLVIVVRNFII